MIALAIMAPFSLHPIGYRICRTTTRSLAAYVSPNLIAQDRVLLRTRQRSLSKDTQQARCEEESSGRCAKDLDREYSPSRLRCLPHVPQATGFALRRQRNTVPSPAWSGVRAYALGCSQS